MVVASFQPAIPTGLVEAINGRVNLLRQRGRSYSNVEYVKLKIFQRCRSPETWAQIVL